MGGGVLVLGFLMMGLGWFEGVSDATTCEFGVDQSTRGEVLELWKRCFGKDVGWDGKEAGERGWRGEGWFGS